MPQSALPLRFSWPAAPQRSRATRRQANGLSASRLGGGHCKGAAAAGGRQPVDSGRWRQEDLQHVRDRIEILKQQVQHNVEQQNFAAAAAAKDSLDTAQLRLRQLELAAAADQKAEAGIQYSLGSVIVHARFNYRGVIVGYDARCRAPERWIQAMRVDSLHYGRHQPFYQVLVDERDRPDGQTTYVAQENIVTMRVPREVQHRLVPLFFSSFSPQEGYIASHMLREAYPQDF